MARFTSVTNGVTVSVSDETAALLGSDWVETGKAPKSDVPDKSWKVADLKAYADENGVDLGEATKKEDILAAIAAPKSAEKPADENTDDSNE